MSDSERQAALRVQLQTLQTRITVHGNRMWQLPFTYVGFAIVAASIVSREPAFLPARPFFLVLGCGGSIVLWAMVDAFQSYKRTANNMNLVERDLGLAQFTQAKKSHAAPHFALCVAAIVAFFAAGTIVDKNNAGGGLDPQKAEIKAE